MRLTAPVLLAGLVLLTGCSGAYYTELSQTSSTKTAGSNSMAPVSALTDSDRYLPLKRTYTWVYQVTISTPATTSFAEDTTVIDTLSDLTSQKTAGYTSSRKIGGVLVSQDTGTITQSYSTLTFAGNGGSETISLPFRAGNTWTSGTFTARCYAIDRLQVGAKEFRDVMAIAYERDGEVRVLRYFALGYGIVKQVVKTTLNADTVTVVSELSSARVSTVTGVSIVPNALNLTVSGTAILTPRVQYEDGSADSALLLTVASQSVATVTALGVVTATGTGSTVLTARSTQDGTKAATLSITVN